MGWLTTSELRIGLGCMRLSIDEDPDEESALETIRSAVDARITVFDTARAYGDNERLLARALRGARMDRPPRIVTKGGMTRAEGRWVPDGRAKSIRADCEASLAALEGLPIDLYLIHAPDPRTPWRTSVRALARLVEEGLVGRLGLANVNRHQLDEALELAPIAAVQVGLSVLDDHALRGGVVERCEEMGVTVIATRRSAGRAEPEASRGGRSSRRSPKRAEPRRRRSRSPGCSTCPRRSSRSPVPAARTQLAPPPARRRSSSTPAISPLSRASLVPPAAVLDRRRTLRSSS